MGLISKTVKVKWHPTNKKHYEELGYIFTKWGDEFEVKVEDLTKGSTVMVKYECNRCGQYKYLKYTKYLDKVKNNGETYCKKCSMILFGKEKELKTKLSKTKSFYDWCVKNNRQDVLDRWDYELNNCTSKEVSYGTSKKYWFKCNKHKEHKSELKSIKDFTGGHEGVMDCKQCNSIAQYILDNFPNKILYEVWDKERNGNLDPWTISIGSVQKCWFICQEKDYHGSYETKCQDFTNGKRCFYCCCFHGKVHPLDSLGQFIIDNYGEEFLWSVWGDKNEKSPFEYSMGSKIKVWWKCVHEEHKDYLRSCGNSVKYKFRCPKCMEEREESIYEEKTRKYIENLNYKVFTEYNCSIRPINPKTKLPLPFDNEIVLESGKHLIIEVHGEQHYKLQTRNSKYLKEGQIPEEYLHKRKLYDRYKRIKCIQAGYEYLEIPYTAFDNKDTYKKLIDNKIKEILES